MTEIVCKVCAREPITLGPLPPQATELVAGLCPACIVARDMAPTLVVKQPVANNRNIYSGQGEVNNTAKVSRTRAGLAGMTRQQLAQYSRAELLEIARELQAREELWTAAKRALKPQQQGFVPLASARLTPLERQSRHAIPVESQMSSDLRDHKHVASSVKQIKADVIGDDGKPTGERRVVEEIVRQSVPREHKLTRHTFQAGPVTPKVYKDVPRFSNAE